MCCRNCKLAEWRINTEQNHKFWQGFLEYCILLLFLFWTLWTCSYWLPFWGLTFCMVTLYLGNFKGLNIVHNVRLTRNYYETINNETQLAIESKCMPKWKLKNESHAGVHDSILVNKIWKSVISQIYQSDLSVSIIRQLLSLENSNKLSLADTSYL